MAEKTTSQKDLDEADKIAEIMYWLIRRMSVPDFYFGAIPFEMMMKFMKRQGAEISLKLMRDYRELVVRSLDDQLKKLEKLDKQRKSK